MKLIWSRYILGLLVAAVCLPSGELAAADSTADSTADPAAGPEVRVYGALHRIMHDADFSSAISLGPDTSTPTTFGLGVLENLRGEVTVIGGRCWVTSIDSGRVVTRVHDGQGIRAALLVTTEVTEWRASVLAEEATLEALAPVLAEEAAARGWSPERPLVFRVQGGLPEVDGHVIDGSRITPEMSHEERHDRAVAVERYRSQPGIIVGFVSDHHQGVFTHRGQRVHAHAVLSGDGITVHLDAVTLPAGTIVELGAR